MRIAGVELFFCHPRRDAALCVLSTWAEGWTRPQAGGGSLNQRKVQNALSVRDRIKLNYPDSGIYLTVQLSMYNLEIKIDKAEFAMARWAFWFTSRD